MCEGEILGRASGGGRGGMVGGIFITIFIYACSTLTSLYNRKETFPTLVLTLWFVICMYIKRKRWHRMDRGIF